CRFIFELCELARHLRVTLLIERTATRMAAQEVVERGIGHVRSDGARLHGGRQEAQPDVGAASPVAKEEHARDQLLRLEQSRQRPDAANEEVIMIAVVEDVETAPVARLSHTAPSLLSSMTCSSALAGPPSTR